MLFDAANTRAVSSTLKDLYKGQNLPPLVVDPVCVSTSGHSLLHPEAVEVIIQELFPLATLITPNKSEAELLLSTSLGPWPWSEHGDYSHQVFQTRCTAGDRHSL